MKSATRKEVYTAIDSERDYQNFRAAEAGTKDGEVRPHSVEEFVLYMDDYMRELKTQLSRTWTSDRSAPPAAMDTLRKVIALGVAAMEQHGAPQRAGFEYNGGVPHAISMVEFRSAYDRSRVGE